MTRHRSTDTLNDLSKYRVYLFFLLEEGRGRISIITFFSFYVIVSHNYSAFLNGYASIATSNNVIWIKKQMVELNSNKYINSVNEEVVDHR